MEAYQQRVIEERDQLSRRVDKLCEFFGSPLSSGVSDEEFDRLEHQLHLMKAYLYILDERIRNFR